MSVIAASETAASRIRADWLGSPALSLAILALAVVQMVCGHLNGDNSWFITFAEKVARGASAYVEVSDPNPPMAFLLYTPAVHAARAFGIGAETATIASVFLLTGLSLWASWRILLAAGAIRAEERGVFGNAALFMLLVAPAFGFAEREHFAVLFVLPLLAAIMARIVAQRGPSLSHVLIAGLCGGLAVCVKPHYALAVVAAAGAAAWRRRSFGVFFAPENLIAAGAFGAYLVAIQIFYPAYFRIALPAALDVYAPARESMTHVVATAPFLFVVAIAAAVAGGLRKLAFDARAAVLLAAALGFLATFVIQAKGWFNHAYPAVALVALAAVALWSGARAQFGEAAARFGRLVALPALACSPFMGAPQMNLPGAEEYPGLTQAVQSVAPARPKIAALAEQLDIGHPLTRRLNGEWVGRQNALWISNCVRQILATQKLDAPAKSRFEAWGAHDRAEFAEDIRAGQPDVLLAETTKLREWAQKSPELADLFAPYSLRGKVGDIEIWTRAAETPGLRKGMSER